MYSLVLNVGWLGQECIEHPHVANAAQSLLCVGIKFAILRFPVSRRHARGGAIQNVPAGRFTGIGSGSDFTLDAPLPRNYRHDHHDLVRSHDRA